jgi:hypothetical protein
MQLCLHYDDLNSIAVNVALNLSLKMKKKLTKNCIWSVAVGSETRTVGKDEEMVVSAFETWS